jgi:cephalosporin hydroxylase
MDDSEEFERQVRERVEQNLDDAELRAASSTWIRAADRAKYEYNFSWLGLPVIQYPQDLLAMQQLIWELRPRAVVETGVARGGSLIFYASMLELVGGEGRVIGVDIDVRDHNRRRIEAHPLSGRVELVEGSSVEPAVLAEVRERVGAGAPAEQAGPVLVCLDSNHSHAHVLAELRAYAPLVRAGSYIVVFDTIIEALEPEGPADRPWSATDNPATATRAFLAECDRFEVDRRFDGQLLITSNPGGFLRCLKNP